MFQLLYYINKCGKYEVRIHKTETLWGRLDGVEGCLLKNQMPQFIFIIFDCSFQIV